MTIWYPQYGSLWITQISSKKIEKKENLLNTENISR